jgi:hypothetical protein
MRLKCIRQIGDVRGLQTNLGRCSSKFQHLSKNIAHVSLTQE